MYRRALEVFKMRKVSDAFFNTLEELFRDFQREHPRLKEQQFDNFKAWFEVNFWEQVIAERTYKHTKALKSSPRKPLSE